MRRSTISRKLRILVICLLVLFPFACSKVDEEAVKALVDDFFTALRQNNLEDAVKLMPGFENTTAEKQKSLFEGMAEISRWEIRDIESTNSGALADVLVTLEDRQFVITVNITEKNDMLFIEQDLRVEQYYDVIPARQGGE